MSLKIVKDNEYLSVIASTKKVGYKLCMWYDPNLVRKNKHFINVFEGTLYILFSPKISLIVAILMEL